MDQRIKLLSVFKNNLMEFLNTTIEQFPQETDLLLVKTFFSEFCSPVQMMNYFVDNLLTPEIVIMIDARNEQFFLKNDALFSDIDDKHKHKVFHFKNLWLSSNNQQKEVIWQWILKFRKIAELYKGMCN
jgi:hypothetical protein